MLLMSDNASGIFISVPDTDSDPPLFFTDIQDANKVFFSQDFLLISFSRYINISCSESMTFWCGAGSGSVDPCLRLMDPNPDSDPDTDPDTDPAAFVIDLQEANKKLIFLNSFFCLLLFEGTFTSFFKDKSKRSQKTVPVGIKNFLTIFA
jgi:hypothetical protein